MTTVPVRRRFRLAALCLLITAMTFVQQPGRVVADTKLDLVVDPGGFLARSFDLWDADGFFGQVQNQAYGYLFPMGPFFWLGHAAHLPAWTIQRLWWSLVLCVAFLGMVALCKAFGIDRLGIQVFAGLMYALSPRMLSVIGPSSIEVWPLALAPWVLLPLVIGLDRGSPRRQAALSALGVACVGGVNAVATFAVIPLGAVWLLTAPRGPRRRALMLWWPLLVLLGTLWWLIPLVLLGSVSPPFLDFIESSNVTTFAATLVDALRGTTNWVPYVSSGAVAGRQLISEPALIVNVGVLVIIGVVGLTIAPGRHRRFLVWSVLVGLVLVTLGHTGSVSGWWASSFQTALDGVLAPLRNTHKFDAVVRVPLVLGAAFAVAALTRRAPDDRDVLRRVGATVLVVAALAGATAPAWSGQLANRGSFEVTPTYWQQASDYLDRNATGTSLLVPSSGFGDYLWGSTGDELMQSIARSPWAVRNSIPLTPAGTIRYLDSITAQLDQARGSDGLSTTLRRAGVEYLVVRNDLQPSVSDARTELVYATLRNSPGMTRVASYGPELGGDPVIDLESERSFSQSGWQSTHPAVDIWRVDSGVVSTTQRLGDTPTLVGAADSLAVLDDVGVTAGRSVILAQDRTSATGIGDLILTDGLRRQEAAFGRVDTLRSGSMTADEDYTLKRRVHDYVDPDDERWTSEPQLRGASSLTASSSASAGDSLVGLDPGAQPWSAFDGDSRTAWTANSSTGWVHLRLPGVRDLGTVRVVVDAAPGERVRLEIATHDGVVRRTAVGRNPVLVDVGRVNEVRVAGTREDGARLSIAEIAAPSLAVSRPIVMPETPARWGVPTSIVLGVDAGSRPACVEVEGADRCRAGAGRTSEDAVTLDRELTMPAAASYGAQITTTPLAGEAVDDLLQEGAPYRVSASSKVVDDVRAGVSRTVDGDPTTGWIAAGADTDPSIEVTWPTARRISSITVRTSSGLPASKASSVTIERDDGSLQRVALEDGRGTFPSMRVDHVVLHLTSADDAKDFDAAGLARVLPVGVSELSFGPDRADRADSRPQRLDLPCGSGPTVTVEGVDHATSVSTTRDDLAHGRSASARLCGSDLQLARGTQRIVVAASDLYGPGRVVLERTDAPVGGASTTDRSAADRVVSTTQNANEGWAGTVAGRPVEQVTVNGWQRAWVAPAVGPTAVKETFEPNGTYRLGLLAGAGALAALVLVTLFGGRRVRLPGDPARSTTTGAIGVVAMVVATGLVAGTPGLVCALVGAAGAIAFGRSRRAIAGLVGGMLLVAGGCYLWWAVFGTGGPVVPWSVPQLFAAGSLGVVIADLARWRRPSAMPGTSTNR